MFLTDIHNLLLRHYGNLNWWPGDSQDEIIIGAILTQNTSWTQVEKAIQNLKDANLLSLNKLLISEAAVIEEAIKPSGFFKQKTGYLKNTAEFFTKTEVKELNNKVFRKKLLSVKGIGQETADSILLYAFNIPFFVIDAYTKRIFSRLGFCDKTIKYTNLQKRFMQEIEPDHEHYNNYHAMIVNLAKDNCRTKPICSSCCLRSKCRTYKEIKTNESCNTKS